MRILLRLLLFHQFTNFITMKRKEIQRKLHDSLINMLYTPPSPPPHENKYDQQTHDLAREIANSDHHHTDELEREAETNFSVSSEEDDELGSEKLTRAQRKRLRRKKLKEAASHRRQIIGPELPPTGDDQINDEVSNVHQQSEGVRRNVTERSESGNNRKTSESLFSFIQFFANLTS
uniref:Uncharacterized protein n=1 Tax=Lactuca sativa TaxID=4236 RepID=A0A9R1WA20_LACSA|nr:hypothetical protein LSAT_V11C200080200 [Lactuca sativa]